MAAQSNKNITLLSGDGIGFEIFPQAIRVLEWLNEKRAAEITILEGLVGTPSIEAYQKPLNDRAFELCFKSDVIILGPLADENKPIKKTLIDDLDLEETSYYAEPLIELANFSPIKEVAIKHLDVLFLTANLDKKTRIYVPEGKDDDETAEKKDSEAPALKLEREMSSEKLLQLLRHGFEKALSRHRKLYLGLYSRGPELSQFIDGLVQKIIRENSDFKKVTLVKGDAETITRKLIFTPKDFDVVILPTEIHSAVISLMSTIIPHGMTYDVYHRFIAEARRHQYLYSMNEKDHADHVGLNEANPYGIFLILKNILNTVWNMRLEAELLEKSMNALLAKMVRTRDIMPAGSKSRLYSTSEIGNLLIDELDKQLALYKNVS